MGTFEFLRLVGLNHSVRSDISTFCQAMSEQDWARMFYGVHNRFPLMLLNQVNQYVSKSHLRISRTFPNDSSSIIERLQPSVQCCIRLNFFSCKLSTSACMAHIYHVFRLNGYCKFIPICSLLLSRTVKVLNFQP